MEVQGQSVEAIVGRVAKAIEEIRFEGEPKELYDPINYILQLGGKRLRPALVCIACDAFGGKIESAIPAAIGIEVFHNLSLVHDDIMDKAALRRGKATVHEKWNENIAILAGDTMLVKAYDWVLKGDYDNLKDILRVFNQAAIEVCEGQQMDMNFESREQVSIEEYIEMIRLKTSVLLGAALKIGACIAGASIQQADAIYGFGVNLGIGFQLMDDYLDAFGDPEKFGKKVGGDIVNNKKTYLQIRALQLDSSGELAQLMLSSQGSEEEKVQKVKEIFSALKVDQACLEEMNTYYAKADALLGELGLSQEQLGPLKAFSVSIQNRVH